MNDDNNAAIDGLCAKIIEQRARIEALEAALRKIDTHLDNFGYLPNMKARRIARAALAPEQDAP